MPLFAVDARPHGAHYNAARLTGDRLAFAMKDETKFRLLPTEPFQVGARWTYGDSPRLG